MTDDRAVIEAVRRPLPGIEVMEWNDTEEDREIGWLLWDKATAQHDAG